MTIISVSITLRLTVFQPLEMTDLSINILLTNIYPLFTTFQKNIVGLNSSCKDLLVYLSLAVSSMISFCVDED